LKNQVARLTEDLYKKNQLNVVISGKLINLEKKVQDERRLRFEAESQLGQAAVAPDFEGKDL
jgi:hypothetical protein